MAGFDDIDCSNFFDHIDDFLDIPEETCTNNSTTSSNVECDFSFGDFKDFPSIWTRSDDFTEPTKSVFSENHSYSNSDLSDDLPVPYEDIEQLEWLSNFVEDSFSAGNSLTIDVPNMVPSNVMFSSPTQSQTTSPVSVLESSGSCYAGGKFVPVNEVVTVAAKSSGRCGRARSERPRPPTFNRRVISPNASFTMAASSLDGGNSECESFGELGNSSKIRKSGSNMEHNKKKNKKKIKLSVPAEVDQNDDPNSSTPLNGVVRKCQHCEITKTPQWRAGPNGPKTLCNACGVRYKSGRLFPEYRPAASPTFVPSIHSNSHKKVLEMRVKTSYNLADSPLIEDSHSEFKNTMVEHM